jgi:arginyl-tRNA synthetase
MTAKEGNTGPYLQYAHARLCSMEDKTVSVPVTKDIDVSLLTEKEAFDLVLQIAKYPLILQTCSQNMEPSTLVTWMFELCGAISSAHMKLKVKDQEINLAKARKLLFWAARITLGNALTMLGLVPLTRM